MNRKYFIENALLWAAAILASAILHAPEALTLGVLPGLAVGALLVLRPGSDAFAAESERRSPCR